MTTLTFDTLHGAPRYVRRCRLTPPAAAPVVPASAEPAIRPAPRKRLPALALVGVIVALHVAAVVSLKGGTHARQAHPQAVPITIALATPRVEPPPPPPPKPQAQPPRAKAVTPLRQQAAPQPAPSLPIVAGDTPLAAPSADTVQVARAAPAAPTSAPALPEKVTEPHGYAGYLHNPAPAYPPAAQKRGLEGQVVLKVHVLASGHPDSVSVARSSGHAILDDAALKAVAQWAFEPARRGQMPIDGWVQVPLNFKI